MAIGSHRMQRDLDALGGRTFDLLVVGGGIHGLTIACDAAGRGLSVALVERGDFGCGASFNHLRTIHGGLRYLQSLDIGRARESIRERRTLARIAPHAVRPLPFALPLYRSLLRGKLAMRAGFLLDRVVAAGRNRGVPASARLPGGHVVSRGDAVQRFPGLRRQGLTGAAVWHDYVTPESDRLTFAWAIAAAEHGATLANYVDVVRPVVSGGRAGAVEARDTLTGRPLEIAARVTVIAAGGGADAILTPLGIPSIGPVLKAMNLVTRRDAGEEALGGRSRSGRYLFLVPWRERALFGTWESPSDSGPADLPVTEADVRAFVGELNEAFPSLDLTLDDVTLVHRGVVPAVRRGDGRLTLDSRERIRDHAADGIEGLISVAGTKYTTARAIAERVTDRVMAALGRPRGSCRTATTPLPGGSARDVMLTIAEARRDHDEGLPADTIPHLVMAYGSRFRDVLDLAGERTDLRTAVDRSFPVIGAEIVWAARHEMAPTLADIVIRRTPLGALGEPDPAALERASLLAAAELTWDDERRRQEIAAVREFYRR
ncbi:MAG TPA: glycerol-3-phosphate dehydrogenase/oxidase [Vicinamibacterales bacterium]|nr:glycerol-3-phosphate dehydrogenase/oxidase [Vicinamibacterales bacterium]